MKVTLIKVGMFGDKNFGVMKPLVFSIFDAITPKDIEIEYIDDRIEQMPKTIDSDIIALSVETFAARRAYDIAKEFKTENNYVIMGGFHPTAMPDEALQYCDTVLVGDAEDTWLEFLDDYKNGIPKQKYFSKNDNQLTKLDFNSRAFKGKKYTKIGLVQFSRGCKFGCDFCSVNAFYKHKVRQKPIDVIVEEIKRIREKILLFIDDNLFLDEKSALQLFDAIKPLKKKWACQISMDIALNDKLLTAMKQSGCILVMIGFETLNLDNLKIMKKSANLQAESYEKVINNIYKHGLMIYASFVLGYNYDTKESIQATLDFALKHNFATASFNPLIPMPDTNLYFRLKEQDKLIYDKWWMQRGYKYGDTVYHPESMTAKELEDGCKTARYKFNSFKNIFKRLFKNKLHWNPICAFAFLGLNFITRKEIYRKQGQVLGGEKNLENK